MRVATFNCNSVRARLPIIGDWLAAQEPDILCLQETKVQDRDFPESAFTAAGYRVSFRGQKGYNGVAIVSKSAPADVRFGLDDGGEPDEPRLACAEIDGVHVVNTYVPQGTDPESPKFQYKLAWLDRLRGFFERHFTPQQPVLWTGDLNVAPTPIDVFDHDRLLGHVCHHPDEFAALATCLDWGFTDVFRKHCPEPNQFTFFDYRLPKSVDRGLGWRIDHILATPPLAERSTGAFIDLEPRRRAKPSDHTFLVADFDL